TAADPETALRHKVAALRSDLELERAPLIRAALFDLGVARPSRLALIFHPPLVDDFSLRLLQEDLLRAYTAVHQGQPVPLPAKTTSFKAWSEGLQARAAEAETRARLAEWLALTKLPVVTLPFDHGEKPDTEAGTAEWVDTLDAATTRALLHEAPI